jgi:undecaprenyl-diphosphatase
VNAVLAADRLVRAWVVAHRVGALDGAMWMLSAIGRGGLVWLAAAAVVATKQRRPRILASTALAVALAALLADHVIKPMVGRERPFTRAPAVRVIGGRPDDASFPSGHATLAFAAAVVLAETGSAAWFFLAAAIAYSRVYLGVHYPLDILGGAVLGLICGSIVVRVPGLAPHPPGRRAPEK